MASRAHNIAANFVGRFWTNILNLVLIPLYLAILGTEAFGLVGLYGSLQAIVIVLDGGLGVAIMRELARLQAATDDPTESRDTLRTVEMVFCLLAAAAALLFILPAEWIARSWLSVESLGLEAVARCVGLMGLLLALQFPSALYFNSLLGLQRQVLANGVMLVLTTVRLVGALGVLLLMAPSVELFFAWHVAVSLLQVLALRFAVHAVLPRGRRSGRFAWAVLRRLAGFATAISISGIVATCIFQMDSLIISTFLPLRVVGYYALAKSIAAGFRSLIIPYNAAVFPHFTQVLVHRPIDDPRVGELFHRSCQVAAVLLVPAAAVLMTHARQVLAVWTGDPAIACLAAPPTALLVADALLYGLMIIPTSMQAAWNWPQLAMWILLALFPPTLVAALLLTVVRGEDGTALARAAFAATYAAVMAAWMFKRIFVGQRATWLAGDLLPVFAAAAAVTLVARYLVPFPDGRWAGVLHIVVLSTCTLAAGVLAAPAGRRQLGAVLARLAGRSATDH